MRAFVESDRGLQVPKGLSTRAVIIAGSLAVFLVLLAAVVAASWPEIELRYHRHYFRHGTPEKQVESLSWILDRWLREGISKDEAERILGEPMPDRFHCVETKSGVPPEESWTGEWALAHSLSFYFPEQAGVSERGHPCFSVLTFLDGRLRYRYRAELPGWPTQGLPRTARMAPANTPETRRRIFRAILLLHELEDIRIADGGYSHGSYGGTIAPWYWDEPADMYFPGGGEIRKIVRELEAMGSVGLYAIELVATSSDESAQVNALDMLDLIGDEISAQVLQANPGAASINAGIHKNGVAQSIAYRTHSCRLVDMSREEWNAASGERHDKCLSGVLERCGVALERWKNMTNDERKRILAGLPAD